MTLKSTPNNGLFPRAPLLEQVELGAVSLDFFRMIGLMKAKEAAVLENKLIKNLELPLNVIRCEFSQDEAFDIAYRLKFLKREFLQNFWPDTDIPLVSLFAYGLSLKRMELQPEQISYIPFYQYFNSVSYYAENPLSLKDGIAFSSEVICETISKLQEVIKNTTNLQQRQKLLQQKNMLFKRFRENIRGVPEFFIQEEAFPELFSTMENENIKDRVKAFITLGVYAQEAMRFTEPSLTIRDVRKRLSYLMDDAHRALIYYPHISQEWRKEVFDKMDKIKRHTVVRISSHLPYWENPIALCYLNTRVKS